MDKGGIYDYPKESNKIQHLTVALYSDADSGETKRSASGWVIRMETESGRYIVKWNSTTPEHPRIQSPLPPSSSSLQSPHTITSLPQVYHKEKQNKNTVSPTLVRPEFEHRIRRNLLRSPTNLNCHPNRSKQSTA
eukprot:GHVN01027820.1.p1 GENE.GHVN01027820.1~~GHVN01027820.1.p1  ORF type:complete len:135 (+),score=8.36 GHVN01027820.1:1181-1585(+)